jgi:hypothetical protein
MFKFSLKHFWDGDAVKERLIAEHKAGLKALAEYVADVARAGCPVDTGALRASIQVISEADGLRHHVTASKKYAESVEYGHTMRNGRFYPPNPFMRRALRAGAAAMPQFIGRTTVKQGHHHGRLMGATFE